MVKHVCVRHEDVGLEAINLNSKNPTCNHHSHLTILLERKLPIVRHLIDDEIVVSLNVFDFFTYLILEGTALKPCSLVLCVEDRKVIECFRQNIYVFVIVGFLPAFLHDVCCQE